MNELSALQQSHTRISYGHIEEAWSNYHQWLKSLIQRVRAKRILEVGGGAHPALELSDIGDLGITEYSILDISEKELSKAPAGYRKIRADICSDGLTVNGGGYDLVISRMLAEHIRHPERFHRNVCNLIAPGAYAFHFFPTLFCPVYILNRLIPEGLGRKILSLATPDTTGNGTKGKFPAYYRWCYGPVDWQISRFRKMGYEVEMYQGFFGHDYYKRIPGLRKAHNWLTSRLIEKPNAYLTSCAYVVLRKPE